MKKRLYFNDNNVVIRGRKIFGTIYGKQILPKPVNPHWVCTQIQKGELRSTFPYGTKPGEFNEEEPVLFRLLKKMGKEEQFSRTISNL